MKQSAARVPVFSPHNGGSKVENLRIMKKATGTHARAHPNTQVHPDIFMAMHIAPFMLKISGCSEGRIWAWVLQCYYYRKPLLPLGSSPPSCSHLILSYITPVSNSILDPEVSCVLASDAIIGFTFVTSSQWNNIAVWIDIPCEQGRLLKLCICVHYHWHYFVNPEHTVCWVLCVDCILNYSTLDSRLDMI